MRRCAVILHSSLHPLTRTQDALITRHIRVLLKMPIISDGIASRTDPETGPEPHHCSLLTLYHFDFDRTLYCMKQGYYSLWQFPLCAECDRKCTLFFLRCWEYRANFGKGEKAILLKKSVNSGSRDPKWETFFFHNGGQRVSQSSAVVSFIYTDELSKVSDLVIRLQKFCF